MLAVALLPSCLIDLQVILLVHIIEPLQTPIRVDSLAWRVLQILELPLVWTLQHLLLCHDSQLLKARAAPFDLIYDPLLAITLKQDALNLVRLPGVLQRPNVLERI